ncbi:MAG: SoxY-related arm protein [Herminiimonas sp.]|nr:SoxY-related arm protein [Herminiimonas sp.]
MNRNPSPPSGIDSTRRKLLAAGAGLGACVLVRPAFALPGDLASAINAFTGGAAVRTGKVTLDVATLVDNGNTVPITVTVDSPMTATDHVVALAVFNERNPQREVARFSLGPRAGKAAVSTRIRLATSQKLAAVAQLSDGTFWSHTVDVVVTLAACIEGEG